MSILKMAWRNIGRNRRRTAVTVAAMTLALFALVVYTGMLQGMLDDMEQSVVEIEVGDLQIHTVDYLDNPSIYELVDSVDALVSALEDAGFRASPRLVGGALVAARDSSAGASMRGVDVRIDAQVSEISQRVADGRWLDPADPQGVVVGRRLAGALGLRVGDELVALSQASDGSMANDLFSVRGVLEGIGDSIDRSAVFLNETTFREFYVLPEGAHETPPRRPRCSIRSTRRKLGARGPVSGSPPSTASSSKPVGTSTWRPRPDVGRRLPCISRRSTRSKTRSSQRHRRRGRSPGPRRCSSSRTKTRCVRCSARASRP